MSREGEDPSMLAVYIGCKRERDDMPAERRPRNGARATPRLRRLSSLCVSMGVTALGLLGTRSPAAAQGAWTLFEETAVRGTVSGTIQRGHIFRTASGHIYELTGSVYEYVYEYSPSVLVLRNGSSYRLVIEGFDPGSCSGCGVGA